jgi:hypothetical protein
MAHQNKAWHGPSGGGPGSVEVMSCPSKESAVSEGALEVGPLALAYAMQRSRARTAQCDLC